MVKLVILVETCHNKKREVLVVLTAIIKSTKLVAKTKTQPVKSRKIHVCYPYIIYSNIEHRFGYCPIKIKVHNMFRSKQHLNRLKLIICQLM
jgi:hypothetical protein